MTGRMGADPAAVRRLTSTMDPAPRHQARERALTLLYEAELKGRPPAEVVDELPMAPDAYAAQLVRAVARRGPEIDGLVDAAAIDWDIGRMAVVDRNVLRLAVAELIECPEVPVAVVLNEAVELASAYSTDDSGRFVNGVLATLARQIRD